jgi:ketosteroid isomerase-like protein
MTGSAAGVRLYVPSCFFVTLDAGGRITQVEEYLDSAALVALRDPSRGAGPGPGASPANGG